MLIKIKSLSEKQVVFFKYSQLIEIHHKATAEMIGKNQSWFLIIKLSSCCLNLSCSLFLSKEGIGNGLHIIIIELKNYILSFPPI